MTHQGQLQEGGEEGWRALPDKVVLAVVADGDGASPSSSAGVAAVTAAAAVAVADGRQSSQKGGHRVATVQGEGGGLSCNRQGKKQLYCSSGIPSYNYGNRNVT